MNKTRLMEAGIDVEAALDRLMGSEALLAKLLGKFEQGNYAEAIRTAFDAVDADAAYDAAHALKGVAGNLSMMELYGLCDACCAAVRFGKWEEARLLVSKIEVAHAGAVDAIADAGL